MCWDMETNVEPQTRKAENKKRIKACKILIELWSKECIMFHRGPIMETLLFCMLCWYRDLMIWKVRWITSCIMSCTLWNTLSFSVMKILLSHNVNKHQCLDTDTAAALPPGTERSGEGKSRGLWGRNCSAGWYWIFAWLPRHSPSFLLLRASLALGLSSSYQLPRLLLAPGRQICQAVALCSDSCYRECPPDLADCQRPIPLLRQLVVSPTGLGFCKSLLC